MLSITGTPKPIAVVSAKLDDVIDGPQQAQAVAAAMEKTAERVEKPREDGDDGKA